jgi:hypothetical protein
LKRRMGRSIKSINMVGEGRGLDIVFGETIEMEGGKERVRSERRKPV